MGKRGKNTVHLSINEMGQTDTILYWSGDDTQPGMGDKYLWNNDTSNGRIRGSCDATQTVTGILEWVCTGSYDVPDGTIFFQGSLPNDETEMVEWGLTGGTGTYANIGGTSMVQFPDENGVAGEWIHELYVVFN